MTPAQATSEQVLPAAAGDASPPPAPRPSRAFELAEWAVIALAAGIVAYLGSKADIFTIDSYYYLAKAKGLMAGRGLTVNWNDGVDRMFFWGYSLALAVPLKLLGEPAFFVLAAGLHAFTARSLSQILRLLWVSPATRLGAVALFCFNPIVFWWASVPMSEVLLVALSVRAALHTLRYRTLPRTRARELLGAALLGGFAVQTRAEGALVGPILLALAGARLFRERRLGLLLGCGVLFCLPESAHLAYLKAHALESRGVSNYLDVLKRHWAEIKFYEASWTHLRAPFWTIFRTDTEPWLYAKHFPAWLTAAQAVVARLYLGALAMALAGGLVRRRYAFACAVGVTTYAGLHAFWFYLYERFDYLAVPAAAMIFAWAADRLFSLFPRRVAQAGVLAVTLGAAAISGIYGVHVSQMHDERLAAHQHEPPLRQLAKAANAANPAHRAVVTDLGPYLAWYLDAHVWFDRDEADFYEDAVPGGSEGRSFLAARQVGEVITWKSAPDISRELGLVPGEAHQEKTPWGTLLVLDLP